MRNILSTSSTFYYHWYSISCLKLHVTWYYYTISSHVQRKLFDKNFINHVIDCKAHLYVMLPVFSPCLEHKMNTIYNYFGIVLQMGQVWPRGSQNLGLNLALILAMIQGILILIVTVLPTGYPMLQSGEFGTYIEVPPVPIFIR